MTAPQKHVLHLASWYPGRNGEQDGDFIQRHLQCIAAFQPVYVIVVRKDDTQSTSLIRTSTINGNLTETILTYRGFKTGFRPLDRLLSFSRYRSLSRKEIRRYINENGVPELVHVHVAMRAGVMALWIKKKYGTPYIVTEHWSGYYQQDPDNIFNRNVEFRKATQIIMQHAGWITTVSADLGRRIKELYNVNRLAVVFNCVDEKIFRYQPDLNKEQDDGTFTFIHVSNMHPIKNVDGIFRVLAKFNLVFQDWRLIHVGELVQRYVELAEQLGISAHIEWVGSVNHTQVATHLARADRLLMFSDHENLSCVVCESLCSGLPVIATRVGGLPEIVHGSNGILVEPRAEDALLAALLKDFQVKLGSGNSDIYDRAVISLEAIASFNNARIGREFLGIYTKATT